VHDLHFEPKHEEFQPRTIWSLSNAFTSAFKELDPIPQFKATAKLGEFLEGRFSQSFQPSEQCRSAVPSQQVIQLCFRSLLKIPFRQRVDHSMKRTLRLSFVVLTSDRPPTTTWQPRIWSVASRALRPQFRDADQVEGRAAEHEQPVHLRQSA
jgi:hypothetical protein